MLSARGVNVKVSEKRCQNWYNMRIKAVNRANWTFCYQLKKHFERDRKRTWWTETVETVTEKKSQQNLIMVLNKSAWQKLLK